MLLVLSLVLGENIPLEPPVDPGTPAVNPDDSDMKNPDGSDAVNP